MAHIKSRSPAQIEEIQDLEAKVWRLYAKGKSSREIGKACGRSHNWALMTVGRLLKERDEKTEQSVRGHVEKLLTEVDLIRSAAWDGWRKSQQDRVKTVQKDGSGPDGPTSETAITTEGQAGDSAFLRVLIETNKRESALRGIEKPVQPIFQFMQTSVSIDTLIVQLEKQTEAEKNKPLTAKELTVLDEIKAPS